MKLEPYPEYNDSGVEWIGDIPETWELHKINQIFEIIGSGTTPKSQEELYYENGVIPWVITGDLNDSMLNKTSKKISREAFRDHSTLKLYRKNSLIIAMYGATIGKISLLNLEACVNQACCVLANSKILDTKFVFYWFLANKPHIISLSYGGGQPNISQDTIKSLRIQVPSTLEQEKIISFLDKKTSEIDLTIEKDTLLIELLKEKRTALINHVVTKGLDPTVKMKDSRVEWIGEIPEDWSVQKAKRLCVFQEGPGLRHWQFQSNGIRVICVTNITAKGIDFSNYEKFISNEEYKNSYKHFTVKKGDLLLSSSGNSWGKVAEFGTDETVILNTSTIRINENQKNKKVDRIFLKWILQAECIREQLGLMMTGSCQPNFGPSHLSRAMMCFPNSLEEQTQIGLFLEEKTSKIDTIIQKIQKNIELLEEYKKSLIQQVVTGKVDVREVAV